MALLQVWRDTAYSNEMDQNTVQQFWGTYFELEKGIVKMGRVLTLNHRKGLGRKLMEKSFVEIKNTFNCFKICVDAQMQASGFYEKCGFVQTSGEFLEEGVVHIKMEKTL